MQIRLIVAAIILAPARFSLAQSVDFVREVQSILRGKCIGCHGADRPQSGLRLDRREDALKGGYSGTVIKPGDSASSRLFRLVAGKEAIAMPPGKARLPAVEVETLRRWIDGGAAWPDSVAESGEQPPAAYSHWSLRPIRKPPVPGVTPQPRNPIDAFVESKLAANGWRMSPEAARHTLLRRVYLDLTGLLPSPAELARTESYEQTVDRLLKSPHFGEKWARMWLDLARYADSDGYEQDQVRRHAWRYRDWVIGAFNRNVPFDRFTVEQIAGDMLPGASSEQLAATGFHRQTLTSREGGIDVEQLRTEQVTDRAITTASVWMGLTFECARCHDHKYDPISQLDFYRLYAFFNSTEEVNAAGPLAGEMERIERSKPEYERQYGEILAGGRVADLQPKWEAEVLKAMADPAARLEWTQVLDYLAVYQDHGHAILKTAPAQRTARQAHDLTRVFLKDPGPLASWPEAKGVKFGDNFKKLEDLNARYPGPSEIPAMRESATRRETRLFLRGDFRSPGIAVLPGTPRALPPLVPSGLPADRLALARWLMSAEHPLTARVAVNRFWQELFGRGLVATPEDFGERGDPPSHPELLDWLAASFRESGWDMKGLIRRIVTSRAYRQASRPRTGIDDPDNRMLARQQRFRLPAELVRDAALQASGLLQTAVGGPSVRPPMPLGTLKVAYRMKWEESPAADRYRRGLYTFFQRSVPHPMLVNFDAPAAMTTCSRRTRSVTPLQALNLLNAPEFAEAAGALAARIERDRPGGFGEQVRYAFELCFARPPSPPEAALVERYYRSRGNWTGAAAALLNLDEFIVRD
ncbi:MAG: DUF1553 domain-containing protein [Acidobacteria bacterium]|nr:DUF1553 domain-containing protein [Acidobacteriota bacterium]